jgi:putative acetyltransferase
VSGQFAIRAEQPGDEASIHDLTAAAFAGDPHSDGSEPDIVDRLRSTDALSISLVAEDGAIVGHVAFSPVSISDGAQGWFGLGPISVLPGRQGQGIGSALLRAGLAQLELGGAAGCVVLGDPAYYGRFGFKHDPALVFPGPPANYFQCLALGNARSSGIVTYHSAFGG